MFALVHNGFVILGPMIWLPRRFSAVISEECGVDCILPESLSEVYKVNDDIIIYPITFAAQPSFNGIKEYLHGPLWTFTETEAIASYEVLPLNIEVIRSQLKSKVAEIRWFKQQAPVDVVINGVTYQFDTSDTTKTNLLQYMNSDLTSVNWKINLENWVTLTQEDMRTVFNAINAFIQTTFDWEQSKFNEINNTSWDDIDQYNIE